MGVQNFRQVSLLKDKSFIKNYYFWRDYEKMFGYTIGADSKL